MRLHNSHTTAEPVLVISGLLYLLVALYARKKKEHRMMCSSLFLTFTTVGFHGTREEYMFALDCIAIAWYLFELAMRSKGYSVWISQASVFYSLTSYFIGQHYGPISVNSDWNTQMMYHSLMHATTAFAGIMSLS
jgi:hypothetical protein